MKNKWSIRILKNRPKISCHLPTGGGTLVSANAYTDNIYSLAQPVTTPATAATCSSQACDWLGHHTLIGDLRVQALAAKWLK